MDHQTFDCLIRFFGTARSRRMAWRALRAEARPEASDGRSRPRPAPRASTNGAGGNAVSADAL